MSARRYLWLLALALLAGCPKTQQGNDAALRAAAAIVATPDHLNLGDQVELSISPAGLLQRYDTFQWAASSSVQGDPWACIENMRSPKLHCVPAAAGALVVSVDISSRTGLPPLHLTKQIVVSGGTEDNPVRLVLDLSRHGEATAFATRSTAAALNANSAISVQGTAVKFDFSRSDRDDLNLQVDDGTNGVYLAADYVSEHNYSQPGDYGVRVIARNDNNAIVARLNFVLSITCLHPNLTLDATQVSLAPDPAIDGRFRLTIGSGFASGGQGALRMRADFNGDAVTDLDWTPIASAGFYSVDAGSVDIPNFQTRNLRIDVADSQCNAHASVAVPYGFPIPRSDGDPTHDQQAQRPNYNFVEANIIGSDPTDPSTNTGYNVSVGPSTAPPNTGPTLGCSFNPYSGVASIPNWMQYGLGTTDTDGYSSNLHGFTRFDMNVVGYTLATQDYNVYGIFRYETAYQPDGTHGRRHYLSSNCPVKISVKTQQTNSGGCNRVNGGATGVQNVNVSFQLVGTFACDNVPSSEDSSSINLRKGAFSCLVGNGSTINMQKSCASPPAAFCGDGYIETGEDCDSGANNGSDHYCDSTCHYVGATCGDGVPQHGEDCDYGARNGQVSTTGYYCSSTCKLIWGGGSGGGGGYCGDGIKNGTEQCDAGFSQNGTQASQCNTDCTSMLCGNHRVEPGEECDNGAANGTPNNPCDATCHFHVQ